jgi:hypothetical protein
MMSGVNVKEVSSDANNSEFPRRTWRLRWNKLTEGESNGVLKSIDIDFFDGKHGDFLPWQKLEYCVDELTGRFLQVDQRMSFTFTDSDLWELFRSKEQFGENIKPLKRSFSENMVDVRKSLGDSELQLRISAANDVGVGDPLKTRVSLK